jgi:hypothetical protein
VGNMLMQKARGEREAEIFDRGAKRKRMSSASMLDRIDTDIERGQGPRQIQTTMRTEGRRTRYS